LAWCYQVKRCIIKILIALSQSIVNLK